MNANLPAGQRNHATPQTLTAYPPLKTTGCGIAAAEYGKAKAAYNWAAAVVGDMNALASTIDKIIAWMFLEPYGAALIATRAAHGAVQMLINTEGLGYAN